MNIEKYKIFLYVSENKKLSEIAKILGISQPTVSFHIKSLEESMGVQLFFSESKHLMLTDAGMHLVPFAKEIVELEANMIIRAAHYKDFNFSEIYIGSTMSPGISILPTVIKNFTLLYEKVHITIEIDQANHIIENTLSKKYDLGLVATISEIDDSIVAETLHEEQLVLVIHPNLLELFQKNDYLKIIHQFNFIHHSHGSSTRKMVETFLVETKVQLTSTVTVNSVEMIKMLIKNNIGISILSYSLVAEDVSAGRLAVIELNNSLQAKSIKLIYAKDRYMPPHIHQFIEFIKLQQSVGKSLKRE